MIVSYHRLVQYSVQADESKDGRLTLDEMLNHPYIFYSTAYDEDEFDYSQHEEFR